MGKAEHFSLPLLRKLSDGNWHNLCSHERQEGGVSVAEFYMDGFRAGWASESGLVERDDTWVRITDAGRRALAEESRDG